MITDVRRTLQTGFETPPAVGLRKSYYIVDRRILKWFQITPELETLLDTEKYLSSRTDEDA